MDLERLSRAYVDSGALYTAADLCVADVIAAYGGTAPISAIAEATGTSATKLDRLLTFLVSRGVFTRSAGAGAEESRYSNSIISELLRSGTSDSLRDTALLPKWEKPAWLSMSAALKEGETETAFELCHKQTFWEYLHANPADSETFSRAMTSYTVVRHDVLRELDPAVAAGEGAVVVDVGAADGAVLAFVLEELRPLARGVAMDLPSVAAGAPLCIRVDLLVLDNVFVWL